MKQYLKIFNQYVNNLIKQSVSAQLDGKEIPVQQDGKGNIKLQIPIQKQIQEQTQTEISNQNIKNTQIQQLITQLNQMYSNSLLKSKSAKEYMKYNNDPEASANANYNRGYADGQKNIIKFIIKKLNEIDGE